ncbi:Fe-S cluster assembly protein SufB [Bulleidia sp. HCP3S3_F2]|jgi:Fe-S cluster assembly protein SufB|uniref:Fe-S cluster assembly protein SufB n=1 Tax=unclassified Bulleidia TaxID=2704656 RepID=UPI002A883018|nr:Fe-S cluster assembly protein SufB [Erysipelotrichaceae bacterium]MDD7057955.1 Fe-S cluster assembly protein SufB [Erysipelotrichaceae bacterium]MDY3660680.1 Fe-S cluster assembly protein SufB [Bulleidia sp.]MEE1399677.1 Fe-S cluster assembly protein SufB [Bulleidia sp.]
MSEEKNTDVIASQDDYKYGFHDDNVKTVLETGKGLTEEIVRQISAWKNEPEWMCEFRVKAFHQFEKMEMPNWGPDLSEIDFQDFTYYKKVSNEAERSWEDVPEEVKNTFEKLGIPEAEKKYLAGVTTQYESEAVYHNMLDEVREKGVLFLDIDSALKEYPDIFKKYFATIVPASDNKLAALNSAVWSGGSFIYVPKGVKLEKPLQSYFRINSESMGQFERSIIIVDDGAECSYVEGCTAPQYSKDSMHAAVVEVFVGKGAKCRYSSVQNWSGNILNLVTKRAKVEEHGTMEWIDGNIGSRISMKYPACILAGEYAHGLCISIAVGSKNQFQDTGAKMIHLAPHTTSSIVSKSVSRNGGVTNFRDWIRFTPKAENSRTKIECDTLILDNKSRSDTIPLNINDCDSATIEHEAKVSKISEDELFYLMSRGLSEAQATEMIVMGFLEPFTRELPMEYAVELNQLMKIDFTNSIG